MLNCLRECFKSKNSVIAETHIKPKDRKFLNNGEKGFESSTFMLLKDNTKILDMLNPVEFELNSQKDPLKIDFIHSMMSTFSIDAISIYKNSYNKKRLYKTQKRCLLCRGANCKYEEWRTHLNPAIKGLNSDQINDNIFASQRLSNRNIKEFDLINQFKEMNIGFVLNLQREGEHPFCGDKLDPVSGFSYDIQLLLKSGIKYKNYGWKKLSIPESMTFMLEIVKDIEMYIKEERKKVLIHCHSGNSRTGITIACFMIYQSTLLFEDIINLINEKRPQCFHKKSSITYCKKFKEYIENTRCLFTPNYMTIDKFMKNQLEIMNDYDLKRNRNLPILLSFVIEKTISIKNEKKIDNLSIYKKIYFLDSWSKSHEQKIIDLKKKINLWNWKSLENEMEIDFLIQILNDWLEDCVECLVSPEKIIKLFSNKLDPVVFEKHINNYNQLNQEQKNEISNKIKFNFSVIEYEVLIAITNFCQEIPPKTPEEEFYYERMLDRISLSITGINLEKINFQFQQNRSKFSNIYLPFEIRFLIQGFKLIIEYFSKILKCNFFHKNNDQNENILKHNNNNHFSGLNENYKIAMESHVTGPSKRINSNLTLNSKFIQFIENHPSQVPQKKIRVRDEEKNCSPYFLINRKVDSKGIRTQHEESIIEDSNQTPTLFSQISSKKNNFIPEGEGPNENNQSFDHHEYYKKCFEGNSRPVSSKIIKKYSSSSINSLTKLNNIAYLRNSKKLCKPNSTILEESDNINNKILFGNESPERNYNISILQDNNYNRTPLRRPSCGSISSSIHYSLQYPNYYERKLIDKNFNSRQNLAKSSDHIKGYLDDDYLFLERLKICQSNKDVRVTQNQGIENYLLKNVKVNRFVTSDIYNDI